MIAALIIAAGRTKRRARFEPLKEVGTITAIQRIVMVFKRAGIERIVVVCDREKTEKLAAHMDVVYLYNNKNAEMLDNVKIGLAYLQDKCTAALITHTEVPLFSIKTVQTLMEAKGEICIPSYRGNTGHPMLLPAEHFHMVLSYFGDGGLAEAVEKSGLRRHIVDVPDKGIITGLQASEDYTHLPSGHNLTQLHPEIRIRLVKEKPCFGPGAYHLLQLTEETNSLRQACLHMGISYSKGRTIISQIEQQLGYSVIESRQGGKTGGYSTVTKKGKELMLTYTEFCGEAMQCVQSLFERFFDKR